MTTFIEDVLNDIKKKKLNFSELTFILPSKRAGVFLKHYLTTVVKKTSFAPEIISVEDFVQELSQLRQLSNVELLFQFFEIYKKMTPKIDAEPFESFSKWAQIVLQDFNEIDRHLAESASIFDYLSAIQELNHWSLQDKKTDLIGNYLKFWKRLKDYYNEFHNTLLKHRVSYHGLLYREAVNNVESYIQNTNKTHVFLGFNALNTAEEYIIQELLHSGNAMIYWDIDRVFNDDKLNGAGHFIRLYNANWPYYKTHSFNWVTNTYSQPKKITAIGCPKAIGQSKYIGSLLNDLSIKNPNLSKTAVVLGEENLLIPVLNSLPDSINTLNVTMGLPLKSIPLASLFEHLFRIHKKASAQLYYKDVMVVLSHQMVQAVMSSTYKITQAITQNNLVLLNVGDLKKLADKDDIQIITLLFENWNSNTETILKKCSTLILKIKQAFDNQKKNNRLELEYLYNFHTLFNELHNLNETYNYTSDVSTLYGVYKELLNSKTLDFKGEPLDGLQIMGVLESRVLDFETVIISSVNEGILPAGKSTNSFIPFDVKIENNLPTYKEKDAIYTYHFFRLIQRAKNVYLLYNTEIDALKGGEKSRFILQLEVEGIHQIEHKIASPKIPVITPTLNVIQKDNSVIERLKAIAEKGFSPSSLTTYIRNPIDFYVSKILGIKELDEVEETVAANTLGTVIHKTLQDFYLPLVNQFLMPKHIEHMKVLIGDRVSHHFKTEYKLGSIIQGKNLIIFEIAKRYISNFLNDELKSLVQGNTIRIIGVETKTESLISIPELDFPVKLVGEVDRIDEFNGTTRIVDYKTGKVLQNQLEITDWDVITTDYDAYSKAFQVLMYAYILSKNDTLPLPAQAGIISFKNLKSGYLKFAKKDGGSRNKDNQITSETLSNFEIQLKNLIIDICSKNVDFIEKKHD